MGPNHLRLPDRAMVRELQADAAVLLSGLAILTTGAIAPSAANADPGYGHEGSAATGATLDLTGGAAAPATGGVEAPAPASSPRREHPHATHSKKNTSPQPTGTGGNSPTTGTTGSETPGNSTGGTPDSNPGGTAAA